MTDVRPTYDDEIDLFEFVETLWDGKWLMVAFVVLAALMGFVYSQVVQPKYDVSVTYTPKVYPVSAQQNCVSNIPCIESEAIKRFLSIVENSWSKDKNKNYTLSFSTSSPLEQNDYDVQIEQASAALTNEMFVEATTELAFIQTELANALLTTESVARNMLNAKRAVKYIENGHSAITFGSVSIVKSSPKVPRILSFSAVLGGMIGMFFIFFRNVLMKRKEKLGKA